MNERAFFLKRRFLDDKHYPYGFSRSGDFSLAEVRELEQNGNLFRALENSEVTDLNDSDRHFLAVLLGNEPAESIAEKAWLKYIKGCNRSPVWLTTRRKALEEDIEVDSDDEFDDVVDDVEFEDA